MILKSDSPLSIDFFYILKNLPWAFKFFLNCRNKKVEEIANSLANILQHARLSYDQIFREVNVSQYIKNEENGIRQYSTDNDEKEIEYTLQLIKSNPEEICEKIL